MLIEPTFVETGDRKIALRRLGSGTPLLCLHGFPQTSACWLPLAGELSSRFELLMPDLPGLGKSDPVDTPDGPSLADAIVALLDELGIERITVVGHDFGGAVAWALGSAHPDRIERLVVVNSPLRRLDLRRGWHMIAFNVPVLPEAAFMLAGGTIVERILTLASRNRQAFDSAAVAEYRESLASLRAQRNAFAYYRTMTRKFVRNKVGKMLPLPGRRSPEGPAGRGKIEVPTLVVWGSGDPVLPVSLTESMHEHVSDLTIEVLDGVGHFVPEEAPKALAQAIRGFVEVS